MEINVTISNISSNINKIEELKKKLKRVDEVILGTTKEILEISKPYVPILTTALVNSGYVEQKNNTTTIGYGKDLDYAVEQHENMSYNHPIQGQAKYLEVPFYQNVHLYKERLEKL